jgi:hypothetical protein
MRIRFLADADLTYTIVAALKRREPGVDFMTASAAGLEGLPDPEVLESPRGLAALSSLTTAGLCLFISVSLFKAG